MKQPFTLIPTLFSCFGTMTPELLRPIANAPATPAKWTYKAIFRVGDQRVGQWSDEVSTTIGG